MLSSNKEDPYFVVKLNTGETLFTEVIHEEEGDENLYLMNPLKIVEDSDHEITSAIEWIPFSDEEVLQIKKEVVYLKTSLNQEFKSFYGSVLMQIMLAKIKRDLFGVKGAEHSQQIEIVLESIAKMKHLVLSLSTKFEFDCTSQLQELEEFEQDILKKTSETSYH